MDIFVFGSNEAGIHGAGSAAHAKRHYYAKMGVGVGRTGQAFAIPTKDKSLNTLPLTRIKEYVDAFLIYAIEHPELSFFTVKIGCGLAGYKEEQIAPMFKGSPPNVKLPEGWREWGLTHPRPE